MKNPAPTLLSGLLLVFGFSAELPAAPVNDAFSAPTIVTGFPTTVTGTNVGATMEINEPVPGGVPVGASVWYEWMPSASDAVQIDTFGSDFDTVLTVWTGEQLTALTEIATNDDWSGLRSAVFLSVEAGIPYRIAVYGFSGDEGNITLSIGPNIFTSAIAGTVTGPDGVTPLQGIQARAYAWDASAGNWYAAGSASTGSNGGYTIGGLAAGTYRVWFYDWNGGYLPEYYLDSQTIDAAADVVVGAATTVSAIDASLAAITRPPNDDFANRGQLGSAPDIGISGSLGVATSEYASGEPDLSEWDIQGEGQSWDHDDLTVWYEWTAPAGAQWARVELTGMNLPSVLSVYTGSALSSLSQVGINLRTIVQLPNRLTFPVTPGTIYQIRPAVTAGDYSAYYWQSNTAPVPLDPDFVLKVSTIGSPVTADEFVLRGRGLLESRKSTDLALAEADFSAALAIDASHDEARFLRALTRLLLVEVEPAADTLLGQLGVNRTDSFRNGGDITMPKDCAGDSIPAVGSHTGMAVDWIDNTFLPRLAVMREDFDLIASNDFRTDLTQREIGGDEVYVDQGDVMALKAMTHGLEMLLNLALTYDLEVSLESLYVLEKTGALNAQKTLEVFTSLLKFSNSGRRVQFAAAMRAMEQDYLAAADFIRNQRINPAGLTTENALADPNSDTGFRDALSAAVLSLDGEVNYQGTRVNLSRLIATPQTLRGWLPQIKDDKAMMGTLPDPTLDGILPGLAQKDMDNRLYQLGMLWGMAQYAVEFGSFLQSAGAPDGPREDADGDGRDNFSEWLHWSDPLAGDVVWQNFTHQLIAPGQKEVRLSFVRRKDLIDWRLLVSVSEDMASWDRTGVQVEMIGEPLDNGDGFTETVTYRLTDVAALAERKFLRVEGLPR